MNTRSKEQTWKQVLEAKNLTVGRDMCLMFQEVILIRQALQHYSMAAKPGSLDREDCNRLEQAFKDADLIVLVNKLE